MLPKRAVIYFDDGEGEDACDAIARYAGIEVIGRVRETDTRLTVEFLRTIVSEWQNGGLRSIVFPYFFIVASTRLLTDPVRYAVLSNVLGVVVADEVLDDLIDPFDYDVPAGSQLCTTIKKSIMETGSLNGQPICVYGADGHPERVCEQFRQNNGCQQRDDILEGLLAASRYCRRRIEENQTIINMAFLSLRASMQRAEEASRDDLVEWYEKIYAAMCEIIQIPGFPIKHEAIAQEINDNYDRYIGDVDACRGKRPLVHQSTISDLLTKLGKREEWKRLKDEAKRMRATR